MQNNKLPVAIIGGGPVGLAAAAQLVKHNHPFILFESGKTVGTNILSWSHVHVFSPWKYNIDKTSEELLLQTGWQSPDKESLHSGKQFYELYLTPLVNHPHLKPFIFTNSKVIAVGRKNMDKMKTKGRENQPFTLIVQQGEMQTVCEARAIIDASGTWQNGNPVGAGGVFAIGEMKNRNKIYYGIPDITGKLKERYKNKNVLVVGGGHSAINSLLELNNLQSEYPDTAIHWIMRKNSINEIFGGKEDDALPARGELGIKIEKLINDEQISVYTPFQIDQIEEQNSSLTITGTQNGIKKALYNINEIISNTGSRPDYSFLGEVRVNIDPIVESVPALADLIDPNKHSCGTVRAHGELELQQPEKEFYIVGMKSYGRAPTFLMATGYEQVRSVVAALVGDMEAARRVELNLPETGVCSSGDSACCGAKVETKEKAVCC